jgi:hypothetical protein
MPGTSNVIGSAPSASHASKASGHSLERHPDLRPEAVRVVELHDAGPRPVAGRRTGVPVDRDDVVAAPGQRTAEEQAGRAGSDDRDSHENASSRTPLGAPTAQQRVPCAIQRQRDLTVRRPQWWRGRTR